MSPVAMTVLFLGALGAFAWSAKNRWELLKVGQPTHESRLSQLGQRLKQVWTFAVYQKKMRYYWTTGVAHQLIFLGFVVLLARSVVLWGRGLDPGFNLWILGPDPVGGVPLGSIYSLLKDVFVLLVLVGTAVFVYYRVIRPQQRMALGWEGLAILGIIAAMMLADLAYDGAAVVLNHRFAEACQTRLEPHAWCPQASTVVAPLGSPPQQLAWHPWPEPGGSAVALAMQSLRLESLVVIAHMGFWVHASLVLIFLNILPYTKHFHIITAIPNVFTDDLTPRGRLRPIAKNTDDLMQQVEQATEQDDMLAARIGYSRIEHFTWKDILDFYTCTECGRCSDNCPAFVTGKILSPKHFTLDLRDHLYARQQEFLELDSNPMDGQSSQGPSPTEARAAQGDEPSEPPEAPQQQPYRPIDLVPNVIHEDVLWACTTCRACEEQCPVNITYVDKIVQMRRNLAVIRGEFPAELNKPFEGMESNGNPWNLSRMDRAAWAEGLDVPTFSEKSDAEVLFWVGCAASYDDRAQKTARATATLLKQAGVDFAILGEEESCTGDPARRAGNEYVFTMLAESNIDTLNGYKEQGGVKKIVTTCPHCFNTLHNEYPDFGGNYEVVHHTDFLLGLVAEKKLQPRTEVKARVAFHDSCYLGRYNDIYDSPRDILRAIPGVEVAEVPYWNRERGLCCGAGGAQMWMEEQNKDRVNVKRTLQLLETGAQTVASACPFCMTMLTDGLKAHSKDEQVRNMDVVELLAIACGAEAGADLAPVSPQAPADGAVSSDAS